MLQIAIKQSHLVKIALISLHGIAFVALWLSAVILLIKFLLLLLLSASAYYHFFYHSPRAIVALSYRHSGWILQYRNGEQYSATLLQPYFVTPHCIILLFKQIGVSHVVRNSHPGGDSTREGVSQLRNAWQRKSKQWIRRQRVMLTSDRVETSSWHQLTLLLRSVL